MRPWLLTLAAAVCACLTLAAGARAEARAQTVAQYRERVREAQALVEGHADAAGDFDPEEEERFLTEARAILPRTQRVEWQGGPAGVDNDWFHEALADYEQRADERSAAQRRETLRALAARLGALEARLAEGQSPAAARDKEAEKGRLNTILRRPEFSHERKQGNALQRQVQAFFEWLRGLFPDTRPLRPGASPGLSRAAQFFIFGLAAVVVGLVLWRFWSRRGHGRRVKPKREARVVLGERLEADQTAADLLDEAERLARDGDLRAAIRKAYVALLCELGDRKVIGLAQHKTNRDYLHAVRRSAPRLYTELLPLTFDFELHWYGAQEASESDWSNFRARCRQALAAI